MTLATCILFDFGDTLAAEDFLMRSPPDCRRWREIVYQAIYAPPASLLDEWMAGLANVHDIAGHLSPLTGLTVPRVLQVIDANCRALEFFDGMLDTVGSLRQRGLKTAIVTLNADVFTQIIVPHYHLNTVVDTIVSSHELASLDKVHLCDEALSRLGVGNRNHAVLIDNLSTHVDAFVARGGHGYRFTDAPAFLAALSQGRVPGIAPLD